MKKVMKSAVVALALALSLSMGAGVTANAAKKKVTKVAETFSGKTGTLKLGKGTKKAKLKVYINKKAVAASKVKSQVKFKTNKKKVATVSKTGVITAKKVGTATITVTSKKNTSSKKKIKVKVVKGKVTGISVDKSTVALEVGASDTVTATVKASKGANKTLKWTTSDKTVATVDGGKITAVKAGTATIKVKSTDGSNKSKQMHF